MPQKKALGKHEGPELGPCTWSHFAIILGVEEKPWIGLFIR